MASMRWLPLSRHGGRKMPCRVGKGDGTSLPFIEAFRAPCPPTKSTQAVRSMVGTAHDRLCRVERQCQRLCPPYKRALLRRLVVEIEIPDLVVDRARVPHAALRIDEEL